MSDGARIQITRASGLRTDAWRAYKVVIDREVRGRIREGQTVTIPVAPGPHEVRLTISRFWRSPVLAVAPADGETARLRCRPAASPQMLWYALIADAGNYIRLEPELTPD